MNAENILEAISYIDDALIDEAAPAKNRRVWLRLGLAAACMALAVGAGAFALSHIGGNAGNASGGSSGSTAPGGSASFPFYSGPVLPLTVIGGAEGVTVARDVELDFSALSMTYAERQEAGFYSYDCDIIVRDRYVLTNTTGRDVTVRAAYPRLDSLQSTQPTVTVDGAAVDAELVCGADSWYMGELGNWDSLRAKLDSTDSLAGALSPVPQLSQTATVYKITDPACASVGTATNPTLAATFSMDYDRTAVLSYGFHGAMWDSEGGVARRSFSIPFQGDNRYGRAFYLIVIGDDIENLVLQGYRDGGCDTGEELDGVTCKLERLETPLSQILETAVRLCIDGRFRDDDIPFRLVLDQVLRKVADDLGLPSQDGSLGRMSEAFVEDLVSNVVYRTRMMYSVFDVTVPAGGTAEVCVTTLRAPSHSYPGGSPQKLVEVAADYGSALEFTSLTARLTGGENIKITQDLFGFDESGEAVLSDGCCGLYYTHDDH